MYIYNQDYFDDQQQNQQHKFYVNDQCQIRSTTTTTVNQSIHSNFSNDNSVLNINQQNNSNDDENRLNFSEKLFRFFNVVRDGCSIRLSLGIDIIRLTLRQPVTVFVLLLFIDFIFNTLMLYYDYVYIMVDVDFGVKNMDTMYVWHEQHHDNHQGEHKQQSPSLDNDDVKTLETNSTSIRNRRQTTSTGRGDNGNSGTKNKEQDSISFVEDSDSKIYSFQYDVNLAVYIIIYASQVNGFFAYIWAHHSWLTLHLTIVAIQIIFLLFLSIVNVRLIIVLLFRMMLFFMSLFRSLEISNHQMMRLQRQGFEIRKELPRVKIFTPNSMKYQSKMAHRTSNSIQPNINNKDSVGKSEQHKTSVTVSDQDGQQVGYITLSAIEMQRHTSSTGSDSTTIQPKLFPIKRSYQLQPSIFL